MIKWVLLSVLLSSCSYMIERPTRSSESFPRPKQVSDLQVKDSDVLLDARRYFHYTSSHNASAYHEDLHKYFQKKTSWPKADLNAEARSLARKGVSPETRVIVLGEGRQGRGEECRLAWNLYYMGVNDVYFVNENTIEGKRQAASHPPLKESVEFWDVDPRHELMMDWPTLKESVQNTNVKVIDARSEEDYLKSKFPWDAEVDVKVVNIFWKDFLHEKSGRPLTATVKKLNALGYKKSDSIVVIDEAGMGAACVVMSLIEHGYNKVTFYAGGYQDLRKQLGE